VGRDADYFIVLGDACDKQSMRTWRAPAVVTSDASCWVESFDVFVACPDGVIRMERDLGRYYAQLRARGRRDGHRRGRGDALPDTTDRAGAARGPSRRPRRPLRRLHPFSKFFTTIFGQIYRLSLAKSPESRSRLWLERHRSSHPSPVPLKPAPPLGAAPPPSPPTPTPPSPVDRRQSLASSTTAIFASSLSTSASSPSSPSPHFWAHPVRRSSKSRQCTLTTSTSTGIRREICCSRSTPEW